MSDRFRILVAEDDLVTRKMTEQLLVTSGYDVTCAENGARALALFKEHFFPIVLTDWRMPEMDGIELCRAIRGFHLSEYVFIVFLTTNDTKDNIIKGLEAGADDYLTKPFDPVELTARLASGRRILTLERSMRENNRRLSDNLRFNQTLMDTMPNPVFHKDRTGAFRGCNRAMAEKVAGVPEAQLRGRTVFDLPHLLSPEAMAAIHQREKELLSSPGICAYEARMNCADGTDHDFLINKASFENTAGEIGGVIGVMMDITEKNHLLKIQNLNIQLAKNILAMVNPSPPRYTPLAEGVTLFAEAVTLPCHAEGGDHFLLRTVTPAGKDPARAKTVVSLKDQSGHQVGCILRSIISDLLHNALVTQYPELPAAECLARLNQEICRSRLFDKADYFTAITAEIHHQDLRMQVASGGHPPLLLIRDDTVQEIPILSGEGANLPVAILQEIPFSATPCTLQPGDRLILYTDGLTEMPLRNQAHTISTDALKEMVTAIIRHEPGMPVSRIIHRLLRHIAELSGEEIRVAGPDPHNSSQDDVTIVGLELEPHGTGEERVLQPTGSRQLSEEITALYGELASRWKAEGYASPDDRLHIVLEEAVLNAWKHGNQRDPEKTITLRWRFHNDFRLDVIDQGSGFHRDPHLDPLDDARLLLPGGRGILLMEHFADQLLWRDGGRHLVIYFQKAPAPAAEVDPSPPVRLWDRSNENRFSTSTL